MLQSLPLGRNFFSLSHCPQWAAAPFAIMVQGRCRFDENATKPQ
jgi:hypothetical protein